MEKTANRSFLAIDLKSFFAVCECLERNLDPFTTPLIVANPSQKGGAMTLAITPYLKAQGLSSRMRVYLIPKNIKYLTASPHMSLYERKSREVIKVYHEFVAPEDMHVYSIDEVFIDVTNYLALYKKSALELAIVILEQIKLKTGLTAVCGIGPNIFLAKIAMDTEAKKSPNNIACWQKDDIETKLWPITPLTKIWGIGFNLARRLNNLGINSVFELAHYDPLKLKTKLGTMGFELWQHVNGIDNSLISDWQKAPKNSSYSHSQVLYKDYYSHNIKIIINEMVDTLATKLRNNHKQGFIIGFGISYAKEIKGGFFHYLKLDQPTADQKIILQHCLNIFDSYYQDLPIRKVYLTVSNLITNNYLQLNLFTDEKTISNNQKINLTIDQINHKYGLNCLLKASSLLDDSTIKTRNQKI